MLPAFKSPHCLQREHDSVPVNTGLSSQGTMFSGQQGPHLTHGHLLLSAFGSALRGHGDCELTKGWGHLQPCALGLDASCLWSGPDDMRRSLVALKTGVLGIVQSLGFCGCLFPKMATKILHTFLLLSKRCKSKPQWDTISHLSEWLWSKMQQITRIGQYVKNCNVSDSNFLTMFFISHVPSFRHNAVAHLRY